MSNILSSGSRAHHGVLVAGDAVRWRGERYSVLSLEG